MRIESFFFIKLTNKLCAITKSKKKDHIGKVNNTCK